jgi:hypothetical protein
VEEALADLPPARRAALLADLSTQVAAKRVRLQAELSSRPGGVRSLLDILDRPDIDWDELPDGEPTDHPSGALVTDTGEVVRPVEVTATSTTRRVGALAWVLIMTVAMILMCAAGAIVGTVVLVRNATQLAPAPATKPNPIVSTTP